MSRTVLKLDAACGMAFLAYSASAVITPVSLITLAHELDFGLLYGGLLESMRTVLIVIALLFSGWAAARWGKGRSLGLGSVALGIGLLGYAVTPGYGVLLLAIAVLGVGGGVIEALVNPMIQDLHPRNSGRYLNILNGFWSAGVLLTVLVGGDLLTRGVSWRWLTAGLGIFCLAVGAGFLALQRHAAPEGGTHLDVWHRKLTVLRHPRFRRLWMAMFLAAGIEGAFTFWSAAYIQVQFAAAPRAGGIGTACFAAGMMIGRFAIGWLVGQHRLRRLILISAACGLLVSLAVPMARSVVQLSVLLFPAGLCVACFWPSIQSYAADRIPTDSTSLFILLSCGGIPGMSLMAWLMGWVGERAGLWWSFQLIPVGFLLLIICFGLERRTGASAGMRQPV